jgi:hypothetical protein
MPLMDAINAAINDECHTVIKNICHPNNEEK